MVRNRPAGESTSGSSLVSIGAVGGGGRNYSCSYLPRRRRDIMLGMSPNIRLNGLEEMY